ncbi:hypothetical protein [Flavobacterium polysaccharolyticum]|uniref:Uncharacterized protein n=1 Tax=Flavobacterium polysaccharolyticum TaxID=3133148 RepID=A0ABU9NTM7_9FLAO
MEAYDRTMPIINELMSYAKENKVSLVGIINYQVAKVQGKKEFFVYNTDSNLPTNYNEAIDNTRNYLNSQGIKFKEEKKYEVGTYYCADCKKDVQYNSKELGTEFKIQD